jgi:hypothetical protein
VHSNGVVVSAGRFLWGITGYWYLFVFQGLLQGEDFYNAHRLAGWPEILLPNELLWPALTTGLLVAAFLVFHRDRSNNDATKRIEAMTIERNQLLEQLATRKRNQQFANHLTALVNQGVNELLNARVDAPEQFAAAKRLDELWLTTVLSAMRSHGCSPQELSSVEVLQDLSEEPNFHPVGDRNQFMRMVSLRLKRLRRIIDLYADVPVMGLNQANVARYR